MTNQERRPVESGLSPERRSLRASIGGYARAAQYDSVEMTRQARAAGPGQSAYWEERVDPKRVLDRDDRLRRAKAARSQYYTALAFKSAQVRGTRRAA